ncbi:MAG: diguanylate cyclase response regulator [Desulfuromonas sp.]|nr:MAG: diguanylate cyclase response regulator [Desulfuromonas sp.]
MTQATILVVDDELFFLRLYSELLESDDYLIETAASGEEAVTRIRQGGIDLVMTDMNMPGVDGLEVLRASRNIRNSPDVIMVTGHATTESAIQALKNGARDYIIKPFNPDELRHLVHTCIEQRRLLNENSSLKSQIELFQKGQNLASLIDLDRLLPQSINSMLQELGGGRGIAFMYGNNSAPVLRSCISMNENEGRAIAQTMLPMIDPQGRLRFLDGSEFTTSSGWPEDVNSIGILPLPCQGDIKGAIILCNAPDDRMETLETTENLLFLSEQICLGFDNAFQFLGTRELVYTDDLTGLFNHRYLHLAIEKEISRASRYDLKFSIIFLDLDHFKQINDTHGHLAGSKTLTEVAAVLRSSVREVDTLFRYGGDEFTALLVETDEEGARIAAERMRASIAGTTFLQDEGINAKVTATIGYATYPYHTGNKFDLIDMADKAMFNGKKERNVIRVASPNRSQEA